MNSLSKHKINLKGIGQIIACCLFLFVISPSLSHAQTRGTLEIHQDQRIDTLEARRLEAAKGSGNSGSGYVTTNGYRVQFYIGTSRSDAYNAQAKFNEKFPEVHTYITYREPNFKVHAGDFRTRLEANKFIQELRPLFPSLFIISEKINPSNQ